MSAFKSLIWLPRIVIDVPPPPILPWPSHSEIHFIVVFCICSNIRTNYHHSSALVTIKSVENRWGLDMAGVRFPAQVGIYGSLSQHIHNGCRPQWVPGGLTPGVPVCTGGTHSGCPNGYGGLTPRVSMGTGGHTPGVPMGTGGLTPGVKCQQCKADHSHLMQKNTYICIPMHLNGMVLRYRGNFTYNFN
jgi:hypothetical protein